MKTKEMKSRSSEYSSETNYDQELENSEVTNFLISVSPDGRIESIGQFGNIDEERPGCIKSLFKATVQSRLLSPDLYEQAVTHLVGDRLSRWADENIPIFQNTIGRIGSSTGIKASMKKSWPPISAPQDPDPGPISHVWVDPKDPEAGEKGISSSKRWAR